MYWRYVQEAECSAEFWFIPHLMVHHNGKDWVVFNSSDLFQGQCFKNFFLHNLICVSFLLGVLIWFHEDCMAVSEDIKGIRFKTRFSFYQEIGASFISLGGTWRELKIYEWQVFSFGSICSPCVIYMCCSDWFRTTVKTILLYPTKSSFELSHQDGNRPAVIEHLPWNARSQCYSSHSTIKTTKRAL